jgi:hypothetical protein
MEHGIIYHRNIPQRMFVVELDAENFVVFESYDITAFNVGDKLYGDFSGSGTTSILHATTLKWHSIVIHSIRCDASVAMGKANLIQ